MSHTVERIKAKQLYCELGKSIQEISRTTIHGKRISQKTLYRWARTDGWDKEREGLLLSGYNAYKQTIKIVLAKFREIAKSGIADPKEIDAIKKLVKSARELYDDRDEKGNVLLGLTMYSNFLQDRHPDEFENQSRFLIEFAGHIRMGGKI